MSRGYSDGLAVRIEMDEGEFLTQKNSTAILYSQYQL